ncbi:MAG: MEDS domain-containing protein [Candidatus Dormibacteria bacterium]
MNSGDMSLGWSDDSVPLHTHACYYYSDEATLRTGLQFLAAGLSEPGDLLVMFADKSRFDQLLGWLQEDSGQATEPLISSGKLAIIGGAPTMDELVGGIGERLDEGMAAGYTRIRFLGFIAWGEPNWPDDRTLLEFESKVNEVVMAYPSVIICTYGVPTLGGSRLLYGGLQTHPVVWLAGRQVSENPFFTPPTQEPAPLR